MPKTVIACAAILVLALAGTTVSRAHADPAKPYDSLALPPEERLPEWAPCMAHREAAMNHPGRSKVENYLLVLENAHNDAVLDFYRPLLAKARALGMAKDENLGVLLRRSFADAAELACLTNGRVPGADHGQYSLEHYRRAMLLLGLDLEEIKQALRIFEVPFPYGI